MGLSFISENQNNLDKALDHMRRVFEMQPTNPITREELKRLHLKRDGVEPSKIRLTRGALINMYSKSNLYPQAIAEIRIGLHQHPNRLDFKVKLACMLYLNNENIKAAETCIDLISNITYCFEANRILSEVLPNTSEGLDVEIYKHRLSAVNPYYAFVSDKFPNIKDIPDAAVMVEKAVSPKEPSDLSKFNWENELEKYWQESSEFSVESEEEIDIDWETIIEKRIVSNKLKDHKFKEEKKEKGLEKDQLEKKNKIKQELEDTRPTLVSEVTDKEIPNWIFEDSKKNIQRKAIIKNDLPKLREDKLNEEIPKIANLSEIKGENIPFDEIEMAGNDMPATTKIKEDSSSPQSIWLKNNEKAHNEKGLITELKEEKMGENIREDPSKLLKLAQKAIKNGNINLALKHYKILLKHKEYINNIVFDLNNAANLYEEEPAIWSILGEAYSNLGQNVKALEAFYKAENKISL